MSTTQPQSRTNLGPLKTTFAQPSGCKYAVAQCDTCNQVWAAQTCAPAGPHDDASCWPTTTPGVTLPGNALNGFGFYSPGLICPRGFTTACKATAGGKSGWPIQFELDPGETAAGCCPIGFNCDTTGGRQTCLTIPTSTIIPTVICADGTSADFGQLTIPNPSITGTITLYAPMIQLNWKSSDRPAHKTASKTSTPSASHTGDNSGKGGSSGIGTGAIVGIVVGVVALLLIIGAVLFWRRRRSRRAVVGGDPSQPKELDTVGNTVHELPTGDRRPTELPVEPYRG